MATRGNGRKVAASVVTAGVAGAAVVQRLRAHGGTAADQEARSRWRAVTVNRSPEDVMPSGELPGPLRELADHVDVEVRPAPAGRGTELRARLREESGNGTDAAALASGEDPRLAIRSALREAKQLLEAGEVLRLEPYPHGHRPATPPGRLVDALTKRAPKEGLL